MATHGPALRGSVCGKSAMGSAMSAVALASLTLPVASGAAAATMSSNSALFLELAQGQNRNFLVVLAMLMGLGKGGVPGASMMAVALNAINAPDLPKVAGAPSGMDLATVLQVPVTCVADFLVVARNFKLVAWSVIPPLLSTTVIGIALANQLMGKIPPDVAKMLVGGVLTALIILNLSISKLTKTDGDSPPSYSSAWWFVGLIGVTGGFATVLTNSMGPMLDIYLLTLKLEPFVQIGTRAAFFTLVNSIKLAMFVYSGNDLPRKQPSPVCQLALSCPPVPPDTGLIFLGTKLKPAAFCEAGMLSFDMLLLGVKLGLVSILVRPSHTHRV